jgi:hypothetical protein
MRGSSVEISTPTHWEPDRPPDDGRTIRVIAQPYSSSIFISLPFRSCKEKLEILKESLSQFFYFL